MPAIDPLKIEDKDLPMLIFTRANNLFSKAIELREDGLINAPNDVTHMMVMVEPFYFISQQFTGYYRIPVGQYMVKGITLNLVNFVNMNPSAKAAMTLAVTSRMALPWYKKTYDFLGIFGQLIGCPWIHNPWQEYCSEDGVRIMRAGVPFLPIHDKELIMNISRQSNPQQVFNFSKLHPEVFNDFGQYVWTV